MLLFVVLVRCDRQIDEPAHDVLKCSIHVLVLHTSLSLGTPTRVAG
jgi:hypothetical protein